MKLLEKKLVEQTIFDGSQLNNFLVGGNSGKVFGLEMTFTSTQVIIQKGLLIVRGYRVVFDNETIYNLATYPSSLETRKLILRIQTTLLNDSTISVFTGEVSSSDQIDRGVGIYDYHLADILVNSSGIIGVLSRINYLKPIFTGGGGGGQYDVASESEALDGVDNEKVMTPYLVKLIADSKQNAVPGKGPSTNDYTDTDKNKLAGIESDAQVNKIEKIKVNGVEQTISNKTININAGKPSRTYLGTRSKSSGDGTVNVASLDNYDEIEVVLKTRSGAGEDSSPEITRSTRSRLISTDFKYAHTDGMLPGGIQGDAAYYRQGCLVSALNSSAALCSAFVYPVNEIRTIVKIEFTGSFTGVVEMYGINY